MVKKRTTLDAVLPRTKSVEADYPEAKKHLPPKENEENQKRIGKRPGFKQQTLYLKPTIHRQLRVLAFEEEKKMHDLILEALDLLFTNRGLPSLTELTPD